MFRSSTWPVADAGWPAVVAENCAYTFDVDLAFADQVELLSGWSCDDIFASEVGARRTCFPAACRATRSIAFAMFAIPRTKRSPADDTVSRGERLVGNQPCRRSDS